MRIHQLQLLKILDSHKEWLETKDSDAIKGFRAILRNADLRNADLFGADMDNADLYHADLSYADLRHANLHQADLHQADLRQADLRQADLRQADLHHADLRHADLRGADLFGADLLGADLSIANLSRADLSYADLSGANLNYTDLSGADLSSADLSSADLRGADIDYSDWSLWSGELQVHIDDRQAIQQLYHLLSCALYSRNTSAELKSVLSVPGLVETANKFHMVDRCGPIVSPTEGEREVEPCNHYEMREASHEEPEEVGGNDSVDRYGAPCGDEKRIAKLDRRRNISHNSRGR